MMERLSLFLLSALHSVEASERRSLQGRRRKDKNEERSRGGDVKKENRTGQESFIGTPSKPNNRTMAADRIIVICQHARGSGVEVADTTRDRHGQRASLPKLAEQPPNNEFPIKIFKLLHGLSLGFSNHERAPKPMPAKTSVHTRIH